MNFKFHAKENQIALINQRNIFGLLVLMTDISYIHTYAYIYTHTDTRSLAIFRQAWKPSISYSCKIPRFEHLKQWKRYMMLMNRVGCSCLWTSLSSSSLFYTSRAVKLTRNLLFRFTSVQQFCNSWQQFVVSVKERTWNLSCAGNLCMAGYYQRFSLYLSIHLYIYIYVSL